MDKSYLSELTAAEQQSNEIIRAVQEARERRLKEAKFDAEQELGKMKKDLEAEYNAAIEAANKGLGNDMSGMQKEFKDKATAVEREFQSNKQRGIDFLLERVYDVRIEIPAVVKGEFN
ncbi:unnamed protein product [Blepharisma stoltei]|uniref:V-type proton ATPase subunit G n=1 Tax=Blepharisma stoltei TaxID=1481888 RepID=A0AAU9J991_9CILI|nr:unnamed protein product [Blepharisma stoltei]CAG9334198.1 unnamed protein product [Blepharisma stoltei]